MYLFHGTSYSNGKKILLEGFNSQNKIWECSQSNKTYFYKSESFNEGIQKALDQSLVSVGLNNESKSIVLVFESNKVKNQRPDISCIGMSENAVEAEISSLEGLIGVYQSENIYIDAKKSLISCSRNPLIKIPKYSRFIYQILSFIKSLHYKKKSINYSKIHYL